MAYPATPKTETHVSAAYLSYGSERPLKYPSPIRLHYVHPFFQFNPFNNHISRGEYSTGDIFPALPGCEGVLRCGWVSGQGNDIFKGTLQLMFWARCACI